MDLSRKQFLRLFAGAGAGALGLGALGACDSDEKTTPDAAPVDARPPVDAAPDARVTSCTQNGTMTTIGTNHGHAFAMVVTKEDVVAGVDKTYNIQGSSPHPHTVTVTAAMFTMLQNNMMVTASSSTNAGHNHTVTITCA